MRFFSTRDTGAEKRFFSLKEAATKGLAHDGGLFMPEHIPAVDMKVVEELYKKSYSEMALYLAGLFFGNDVEPQRLKAAVERAYDFPIEMKYNRDTSAYRDKLLQEVFYLHRIYNIHKPQ